MRGRRLRAISALTRNRLFCSISAVQFAFQSPRSSGPYAPIASLSSSARMRLGKIGRNRSLHAPTRANIPASPYGSRRFGTKMEQPKLANRSGHKVSSGHSPSSALKKADRKRSEPAGLLRKETGSKLKPEKLVCRYCGSHDLAPSFIKRRDRRCRKCFGKRYGSAARARKAKIKKK